MRVEIENLSKSWDGVIGADKITLDIADGDLVAFLVTADTANPGTITVGEVSIITIANILTTDGISAADIVLI